MSKAKIVGVDGKPIGGDIDEKIEELEKRMAYIEQACSLYGTVFTILKRFFDAIPGADTIRKSEEKRKAEGEVIEAGEDTGATS